MDENGLAGGVRRGYERTVKDGNGRYGGNGADRRGTDWNGNAGGERTGMEGC